MAKPDRRRGARLAAVPDESAGDELFAAPPAEFVQARNALVRRLRAAGQREAAEELSQRRRPTPSVWALNQVARQRPALVEGFRSTAEQMRAATQDALAGDADPLRTAQPAALAAIDLVVEAAEAFLVTLGEPANAVTRQRMVDTLRAATTDARTAELLRAGRLIEDRTAAGLGLEGFSALHGPASSARRPEPRSTRSTERDRASEAAARRARAATERWTALDRAARDAEAEASALEHEARQARRQADRAVAAAAGAERSANGARRRAEAARSKADRAEPH